MKNIITFIAALALCLSANAQNSLQGNWLMKQNLMGISVSDELSFDADEAGNVSEKAVISNNSKIFGAQFAGEVVCNRKGTFVLKDGALKITWDAQSSKTEITVPAKGTMNGNPDAEMQKEAEAFITEIVAEFDKSTKEGDVYEKVVFRKGKVLLTSRDENGKKETDTYIRQ